MFVKSIFKQNLNNVPRGTILKKKLEIMNTINASLNDAIERIIFADKYQPSTTKVIEYGAEDKTKEEFSTLFLECISFNFTECESVEFTVYKTNEEIQKDSDHIKIGYRNSAIQFLKKAYHSKEEYKQQLDHFLQLRKLTNVLEQISKPY